MNINIGYSNEYKFDKSNNGIPFNFCYKEINDGNLYNFGYDIREEGIKVEKEAIYLENKVKEIMLADRSQMLKVDKAIKISKLNNSKLLIKEFESDITIIKNPNMLYKTNENGINIFNNPNMFYKIKKNNINITDNSLMLYKIKKKGIRILENLIMIYSKNKRAIRSIGIINSLEYYNIKNGFTKKNINKLTLNNLKNINMCNYSELGKLKKGIVVKFSLNLNKAPKNITVINSMQLSKIPKNIRLNDMLFLGMGFKDIFSLKDIKCLELFKRLWWLNGTEPTDKLTIPMDDYSYSSKQLNNNFYEYLKFDKHPISWGDNWGIDYNIPPSPTSVEIMLDLVNIITMLWHYNYINWKNVTGKEAIQLLMELLYNWYTLDTSKPNMNYYRVYRWIRWEAEKVYFLAKDDYRNNGAKYVGTLATNLIEYLKIHHFDIVPIQQNIMRMGSIRINNQQDNLMKNLDKEKGKRFYYIETQNFERKKVL